jgi:hypothetical protein
MVFELNAQFITEQRSVTAEYRCGVIVVETPGGPVFAHSLARAVSIACEAIGPLMERADRAGEGWGLMVSAGPASVAYGNWPSSPPREPTPQLEGLRRILDQYRPGDGARGALNNAAKVIEAFAEHQRRRRQSSAA